MGGIWGTREVAKMLGINVSTLTRAIWEGRIDAPAKGPGCAFLWTLGDIERASWALLHRPFKLPTKQGSSRLR